MTSEREETNEESPTIFSVYCPRTLLRLQYREGKPREAKESLVALLNQGNRD